MSDFRTKIESISQWENLNHNDYTLFIGSCFSENIGDLFKRYLFNVDVNPFGIIYNPVSAAKVLDFLIQKKKFDEKYLFYHNGLWNSYLHHGDFSNPDKEKCLQSIISRIEKGSEFINKAKYVFVTFGTAFVYKLKKNNLIVSNCHKVNPNEFDRLLLTPEEISKKYNKIINDLININPNINIVFTVSPVRHIKDGLIGNQRSKAVLITAINNIIEEFKKNTSYFPAYEIMIDDLRDYRFYSDDMLHPNNLAIKYIWQYFSDIYFSDKTKLIIKDLEKLRKLYEHRPIHLNTKPYNDWIKAKEIHFNNFKNKYPEINLDKFIKHN
ncbi:MAG: GSCFA domain-containing protein [Marinilabiliales bacterium]